MPSISNREEKENNQDNFIIENSYTRAYIKDEYGKIVYTTDGKLKKIHGKIYRLNLKKECFTIKDMLFNGEVWMKGSKKIVAYPRTKLYRVVDYALEFCDEIEDIVDNPVFKECKLKVGGEWYNYQGEMEAEDTDNIEDSDAQSMSNNDKQRIAEHPLYAIRKQAILRAMGFFRLPVKIKDIARTISRTAWGAPIKEDDVEEIISTLSEVKSDDGRYILRK